jgi:hypothetical protein
MSLPEQASFFAKWGDDVQSVVASRFKSVETTLARLLFLQEARSTLGTIVVRFILDRTYSGAEIGHFRAFTSFSFPKMKAGLTEALFGSTDNSKRFHARPFKSRPERPGISHGISSKTWESRFVIKGDSQNITEDTEFVDEKYVSHGEGYGRGSDEISQVAISYSHTDTFDFHFLPRLTLEDLQGAWIMPKLNAGLADKLNGIEIWADGYVIMSLRKDDLKIDRSSYAFPVDGHFTAEELTDPWVRLRPSNGTSCLTIDFSRNTPKRAYVSGETDDPFRPKARARS